VACQPGGVGQRGEDVIALQVGECREHLINGQVAPNQVENVAHTEPEAADAWLAGADRRVEGHALQQSLVQALTLSIKGRDSKGKVA